MSALAEETNASSVEVTKAVRDIAIGATQSSENADQVTVSSAKLGEKINQMTEQSKALKGITNEANDLNQEGQDKMYSLLNSFENSKAELENMARAVTSLREKSKPLNRLWIPSLKSLNKQIFSL